MNKVELRGGLLRDAAVDYLPSGDPVMRFTLAVNGTRWSRSDNAHVVTTAYISCRMYADQVIAMIDAAGEPKQGDDVYVVGELAQIEVQKGSDPTKTEKKTGVTVFHMDVIRRKVRPATEPPKDPWG